jgi:hypothetical protein
VINYHALMYHGIIAIRLDKDAFGRRSVVLRTSTRTGHDQPSDANVVAINCQQGLRARLGHQQLRWRMEVTFEEAQAHLGIETQRQWSDLAIARTTPVLFGLFSLVTLMADRLIKGKVKPVRNAAWYAKERPTFSDAVAIVRRCLWSGCHFSTSSPNRVTSCYTLFQKLHFEALLILQETIRVRHSI